ncbi:retrovirus-related pol polyprotein from transposon TNT 1-94 [Tanacetum coccineum]
MELSFITSLLNRSWCYRNTTDPSVAVTDSSAIDYDSTNESLVCSTPLPLLKKLDSTEPIFGPKASKSILRSKSTFKSETLKGVKINEPSSTLAKGNKSSSDSKVNSAPCDIKKPIWYLDSGCSRHMTGVKSYLHKYEEQPGPKVVFGDDSTCTTKGYGSIKCNGIVFTKFDEKRGTIFNSNKEVVNQHHTGQGKSSSRSKPSRSAIPFPSCIYCGYNDHQSDDCVYYPICELCGSYDPDTHSHNRIISLRKGIKPRNPQHVIMNCKHVVAMFIPQLIIMTLNGLGKEKLFKLRKLRLSKQHKGINYDKTYAPVARLKEIRIFLAFATYMNFIVYQIDVKSAFLNSIVKEVYVKQPPGFKSSEFLNHVCKLDKALYGLKQAPREWYLKGTPSLGLWYPKCSGFDLKGYFESDYVGCNMDKKSTLGACQLLGGKLVCWSTKKQQSVAMSSAEAEYVAIAGCCANILWMKSQLTYYDIIYEKVSIFCDNTSAIAISNNPVLHSRTKHIDIRYHILKGDIELHFILTQYKLTDIFTKPLDEPTFKRLIVELGMLNIDSKPEPSILTEEN